jgi:hypothetical protein
MVGRLFGLTMLVGVATAVSAAPALACNQPEISVSTTNARPGGWVNFTVSATDAGAGWTVYVQGQEVASGTDADGGGVASRFEMPDLGDSDLPAAIEVKVTHPNPDSPGGDYHGGAPWWGATTEVGYRARAAARAPAPVGVQQVGRAPARAKRKRRRAAAPKRAAQNEPRRRHVRKGNDRKDRSRNERSPNEGSRERRAAPAVAPPAVPARSESADRAVPEVAPSGIGMKGAVGILFLLTVGCAFYGRFGTDRRAG